MGATLTFRKEWSEGPRKSDETTRTLDLPDAVGGSLDAFTGLAAVTVPDNLSVVNPVTFSSEWPTDATATIHYVMNLSQLQAGDIVVVTIYRAVNGTYGIYATHTYSGVQNPVVDDLIFDTLEGLPVKVGIKQTAGVKRDVVVTFWAIGQNQRT